MVHNKTEFKNLSEIDSNLPDNAIQKLNNKRSEGSIKDHIRFNKLLLDRDVVSNKSLEKIGVFLELDYDGEIDQSKSHILIDYSSPIVSGSYYYDYKNNVAFISNVIVQDGVRGNGYGTQMKKHLINMIKQESSNIKCYTWLATDGGLDLANKTDFTSDKEVFDDIDEI